jgi:AraC family transcriptional regulator
MHMTIVTLPELKLAGLPFAGPFSILGTEMPKVWSAFLAREAELKGKDGVRYGVHLREHEGVMLECIAGPIEDLNMLPAGMTALRIPGGRYAMFTHRGPMTAVQATYLTAFAAMEQLGLRQDTAAWRLERYDRRFTPTIDNPARPDNAYDILIPLCG